MIELMQFPFFTAPTTQGQVDEMKEYLFRFVQQYNLMAQEVNKEISEIKERVDNGRV